MNGIALVTYNRSENIGQIIEALLKTKPIDSRLVVCDDGSTDDTNYVCSQFSNITYIKGENKGVGANKNRALFTLQDCDFIAIIEDDLIPVEKGWFDDYLNASIVTGIHHFCRVQENDKNVPESIPSFTEWMTSKNATPMYRESPRGDLTFITKKVIKKVGAFHPDFIGVGGAHGEFSNRVFKANLIPHPLRWIDFKEVSKKFIQLGDQTGGRWLRPAKEVKQEIKRNSALAKKLRATNYLYHHLVFP